MEQSKEHVLKFCSAQSSGWRKKDYTTIVYAL